MPEQLVLAPGPLLEPIYGPPTPRPAVVLFTNPYCRHVRCEGGCWRALCPECGTYIAAHEPTREEAERQARWYLANVHRCHPHGCPL